VLGDFHHSVSVSVSTEGDELDIPSTDAFMVNRKALPAGTPVNVKNAEFFKRLKEVNI
jgi:hypothetical protein